MNRLLVSTALATALVASVAQAHTTSLGYTPGPLPGSITVWSGHYSHGGFPPLEGTAYLDGVNLVYSATQNYSIGPVSVKPVGLVDGVTNFFWSPFPYNFPVNTDPHLFGGVVHWQGVNFFGLTPGTYDFSCRNTCGVTQEWASLSQVGGQGGTVRFTLSGQVLNGVPEPTTWALMIGGFGLAGLALRRRRTAVA